MKRIILFCAVLLLGGCAGSYPFAEVYTIDAPEQDVIAAIDCFFEDNPQYKLPEDSYLIDSQCERRGYWYHVYFYLPDENKYLYAWTRDGDTPNETTFALIAISKNLGPGNWQTVNDYWDGLSRKENKRVKQMFETRFLEPIKQYLGSVSN